MSQQFVIDSLAFAREAGSLQGELPIAGLTRVLDLLADSAGNLVYRVEGKINVRYRSQLLLQVDGVLSLCCPRCLEGVEYPMAIRSLLEFVDNEDDLTQAEIEDDSRDYLVEQKELDIVALIEDEILLSLPSMWCHESCVVPEAGQKGTVFSPFSSLAGLQDKAQ
jgi:uncharacterized protein